MVSVDGARARASYIHAGRGREYRIAGTSVDGYYEVESENETSRYVLQFHGCFWYVVPAVIKSIAKENLRPGCRAKIQSTHDTNELSQ